MKTVTLLDGTPLPVLGLGTWSYGGGNTADYSRDEEDVATLRRLIAMGYTHLDTAEGYGRGHSEELVGQAIKSFPRESVFITTKVSPEHFRTKDVISAAEGSLRRLDISSIDLYLLHWPNDRIPLVETFQGINTLLADGRIKRVGVSNFSVSQMREAMRLAQGPIITNQVHYNLLHREPQRDGVLALCQAEGIALTAYSPLKDNVLANSVVKSIAVRNDVTPAQVAIRWLLRQPLVITIPKTSDLEHAADNIAALDLVLTDREVAELDAIVA
jgi:diketogulonate reductase-like aldo/keto reductase